MGARIAKHPARGFACGLGLPSMAPPNSSEPGNLPAHGFRHSRGQWRGQAFRLLMGLDNGVAWGQLPSRDGRPAPPLFDL